MSFSKKTINIIIGLIVMGLSLSTCLLSYRNQREYLDVLRPLQIFATAIMIYGILKAHPAHMPKMLLFWLAASSIFCTILIYVCLDYITNYNYRYYRTEWYIGTVAPLLAAAGVAYMMNKIYEEYVELTLGADEPVKVNQPPKYDQTLNNFVISSNV
ncbi:uncharacterized protein LOC132790076 isoform X1 [Drosophila nasuta]|uniref:uncharacterized protein LOC132790076 isoform X1 n=1 Tax=Drosophila nasuta TaxID=42062 RepID=UPI00295F1E9B|nr:uncharacterized protein LOC132790076 isoform X1 [Drosophila nasuta]